MRLTQEVPPPSLPQLPLGAALLEQVPVEELLPALGGAMLALVLLLLALVLVLAACGLVAVGLVRLVRELGGLALPPPPPTPPPPRQRNAKRSQYSEEETEPGGLDFWDRTARGRPKTVFLVRHGESEGNVDKNIYEHVPDHALHLTPRGWQEAARGWRLIRERTGNETVRFICSPYVRTRETLNGIALVRSALEGQSRGRGERQALCLCHQQLKASAFSLLYSHYCTFCHMHRRGEVRMP